jgi:hypothetical protein
LKSHTKANFGEQRKSSTRVYAMKSVEKISFLIHRTQLKHACKAQKEILLLNQPKRKINFTKGWFQHTDKKKRGKRTVIIINLKETKVRVEKGRHQIKISTTIPHTRIQNLIHLEDVLLN